MHILWKRKTHATNRQTGEPTCPHNRIRRPKTLTPIMNFYDTSDRKYKAVWRLGPSIRECCLNHGLAQAAWWTEVDQRFVDLARNGIEGNPVLANALLTERELIEKLLETVVPRPNYKWFRQYEAFRKLHQKPRPVKIKLPTFMKVLEITTWPMSEDDLKAVWRKLALKHHPDRGGSQMAFIQAKAAYDEAVRRLENG